MSDIEDARIQLEAAKKKVCALWDRYCTVDEEYQARDELRLAWARFRDCERDR